jgi:UPF0755 protein
VTRRILTALLATSAGALAAVLLVLNAPVGRTHQGREFEVRRGESCRSIAVRLKSEGFLRSPTFFVATARLTGSARKLQQGLYLLSDNMSALQVLHFLAEGRVFTVRITIPEGWPAVKIARLLEEKKLIGSRQEFLSFALRSDALKTEHRFLDGPNLEGYLYPDTYDFPKNTTVRQIASVMVIRWSNRIYAPFAAEMRKNSLKPYDLLKLASLIEKEARIPAERPLISQVFHKRLKKGIGLFCDPTVAYAVGKHYGERLRSKDLKFDSPFNTYLYPGLTPTPICNPGEDSFKAALRPAATDFMYFVAKNDGSHQFSRTLAEHNAAVDKYQKHR